uniref:Leucine-rich repeat-containing protein n=1 Tax=Tanacetum cinerariifolium TaxID=118510 RepID=A0A6L2L201_TANCI|nr:leucine-rich repeat-containing protein [Tanacetum cinerariifolium]
MRTLQELTTLDMSNNRLTGRIPSGGQMDTMTGFQNNSGLCGMQIEFLCPEAIIPSKRRDEEHEDLSRIFWEGTWIGFPVGFFISILIMGYLLNFSTAFQNLMIIHTVVSSLLSVRCVRSEGHVITRLVCEQVGRVCPGRVWAFPVMVIDKSWTSLGKHEKIFYTGIKKFVDDCKPLVDSVGNIRCPCKSCHLVLWVSIKYLSDHISKYGFDPSYKTWIHHGESDLPPPPSVIDNTRQPQRYCMKNSKRGSIPMQEKLKLSKSQSASTPTELKRMQNVPYASAVGFIMVSCYADVGYLTDADDLKSDMSEYIAVFDASKEAVWVRKFISGLDVVLTIEEPISMYRDNTEGIAIANESGITKGARHFRAKVHYLREVIEYGDVKLKKVHTYENLSDPFIKALAFPKHSDHIRNIGMLLAISLIDFGKDISSPKSPSRLANMANQIITTLKQIITAVNNFGEDMSSPKPYRKKTGWKVLALLKKREKSKYNHNVGDDMSSSVKISKRGKVKRSSNSSPEIRSVEHAIDCHISADMLAVVAINTVLNTIFRYSWTHGAQTPIVAHGTVSNCSRARITARCVIGLHLFTPVPAFSNILTAVFGHLIKQLDISMNGLQGRGWDWEFSSAGSS